MIFIKTIMLKSIVIFCVQFLFASCLYGQINMQDSTSQVVGYWNIGESQTLSITDTKYEVKNGDSTNVHFLKYEVDVTIKDSTENNYLIEWHYKNYAVETQNPIIKRVMESGADIKVLIKTDAFGSILEVVNWEEVRDYIIDQSKTLNGEFGDLPELKSVVANMNSLYSTKESIENNAIKDAMQYYTYHGRLYKLKEEVKGNVKMMNNYGGEPFDSEMTVILDMIDEEHGESVIKMKQVIDSKQLTDATFDYLKNMGIFGDKLPKREEFPLLSNEIWIGSVVHSYTGWVTYSIETREVVSQDQVTIIERIIELK
jgi:hypothetical protein